MFEPLWRYVPNLTGPPNLHTTKTASCGKPALVAKIAPSNNSNSSLVTLMRKSAALPSTIPTQLKKSRPYGIKNANGVRPTTLIREAPKSSPDATSECASNAERSATYGMVIGQLPNESGARSQGISDIF